MSAHVDVSANRRARKWTRSALVARVFWALCQPLFRFSPRPLWAWRVFLLRRFGAQIGRDVNIYPTARIMIPWHLRIGDQAAIGDRAILYALGPIRIGVRATVSQNAHLCAGSHDLNDPARPLINPPITIGADAWVCADAFIGPGVQIGANAVVGACCVAMKDLPASATGIGNPMQIRVVE